MFQEGNDVSSELDRINSAIETARKERDLGLYDGDDESYYTRMRTLVDKRTELQGQHNQPSGYVYRGTGETYREAWGRMDSSERRDLLLETGVTIAAEGRPFRFSVYWPDEFEKRLGIST